VIVRFRAQLSPFSPVQKLSGGVHQGLTETLRLASRERVLSTG
jgi:hypothetical protein